jgi:hypothetical protein
MRGQVLRLNRHYSALKIKLKISKAFYQAELYQSIFPSIGFVSVEKQM